MFRNSKEVWNARNQFATKNSKLRKLQSDFLEKILCKQILPIPPKGFVKGESYKSFLTPHRAHKYFMRLDISDFFGSITKDATIDLLDDIIDIQNKEDKEVILELLWDLLTYKDRIPQGVSTSPMLSNLVFRRLDQRILKYCQTYKVTYTRYADDLFFSSESFNFIEKKWFKSKIALIIKDYGFQLNYSKTKMSINEISLNGYVVGEEIRFSRKRLKGIRIVISILSNSRGNLTDEVLDRMISDMNSKVNDIGRTFDTPSEVIQYLLGYRSFLISWKGLGEDAKLEKDIQRILTRIERIVIKIYKDIYGITIIE